MSSENVFRVWIQQFVGSPVLDSAHEQRRRVCVWEISRTAECFENWRTKTKLGTFCLHFVHMLQMRHVLYSSGFADTSCHVSLDKNTEHFVEILYISVHKPLET